MRIEVFKDPELREWLQSAGMKRYVYRPFTVNDKEMARLEAEARLQHPNESPSMTRARGVGRALALKLSREKRSKDVAEQTKIFKSTPWDWGRIFDRVVRVLIVGLLLLIFLLGIPLRGNAQQRSLRVQWKDEGSILGTRGGGNLWIIDCTGAGLTCTISGATITIDGSAGGGGYATIDDEGVPLTQRTTLNLTGAGVTCVDDGPGLETDCDIPGGAGNSFGTIGLAIADTGADTLTVTDSSTVDFTTTDDPEDLTAIVIANSITAAHLDETVAFAFSNVGNTFIGASYTSSAADPADAGVLRAGNAEDWVCVESAPTGAEICAQLDASENWQFDNDLAWLSGTAFQGVLAHANTALRTYTFGDRNMTVAAVAGAPVTGNCAEFDANDDLVDAGAICGGAGDGVGYDEILDEATGRTKRAQLNFIGGGVSCVDNPGATRTDCTIAGGGTSHEILSGTHTDTTTATVVRGDLMTGQLATPKWQRLALGGTNLYPKSDGTDIVYSTLAAGGVGSCANQFVRALNADAVPTCNTVVEADIDETTITGVTWGANADFVWNYNTVGGANPDSVISFTGASINVSTGVLQEGGVNVVVVTETPAAGDISGSFSAGFTIDSNAVTNAILRDSAGFSVIGKATTGSGDPADIVAGDETVFGRTAAGNLAFAALVTGQVTDNAITFAKMQNIATDRLVGRDTAGSGSPEEIALNVTLEFDGSLNLQRAALTGDVTASAGSNATLIAAGVVASAELATPNKTFDKSIGLIDPTTADDDKIQWMHGKAVTYTDIDCSTDAGTTVTIDMDHRVITTPNTTGTDIITGTIVCDDNNQSESGFADATIPANVPVNLSITATSGTPGVVRIHIRGTVD